MAIQKEYQLKSLDDQSLSRLVSQIQRDRDAGSLNPEKVHRVFFFDERPIRTLRQNRYLWGIVYHDISMETGQDPEEIHEQMKRLYATKTLIVTAWGQVELKQSTTDFNTAEMTEFIDKVRRYWLDREVYTRLPNELDPQDYIRLKYLNVG